MTIMEYTTGYNDGYRAGLRHKGGKAVPHRFIADAKPSYDPNPHEPMLTYNYMVMECQNRGGYMFEGARPAYERGEYVDPVIAELLRSGLIKPHPDPLKGWVPVIPAQGPTK